MGQKTHPCNIVLQLVDGIATYQGFQIGVQEANPLVRASIAQWGVETVEKGFFAGTRCHLPLRFNLDCSCRRRFASLALWAFTPAISFLSWLSGLHYPSTPPFSLHPIVEEFLDIMDHAVEHPLDVDFDLPP